MKPATDCSQGVDAMFSIPRISKFLVLFFSLILFEASCAESVSVTADAGGPYTGFIEKPVQFDGTASRDPDHAIMFYDWDFGDDSKGIGPRPVHTYKSAGEFTVTLKVSDDTGEIGSATTRVTISTGNQPPECDNASPSRMLLWPPDTEFIAISILGITDPDGDPVTIVINGIHQDEQVVETGSHNILAPDGTGTGSSTASIRAERRDKGNGRVYHIGFTATDPSGALCKGLVMVSVPRSQNGAPAVDDGASHDSTLTP